MLPLLLPLLFLLSLPLVLLPVTPLLPLLSLLSLPLRLLSAELYLHILPVVAHRGSAASSLSRILASVFPPAWFFVQASPVAERRSFVLGFEWAILGSRQVCFAPAPASARVSASAHADTTSPAGPAALAAVPSADFNAATAAVTATAHSSVSVTRACAPATVLVAVFFILAGIILGFEWIILGSRQVCFGFGLIISSVFFGL